MMVQDQQFPGPHGRNAPRYAPAGARRSRHPCLKCYCWCCCGVFVLLLLFAGVVAAGFAIINPSYSKYVISDLTSNAFNLTEDFDLHARFVVTVIANNPNKYISIVYGKDSSVDLSFRNETFRNGSSSFVKLCSGKIPEFKQPTTNITSMKIDLKGDLTKGDFTTGKNNSVAASNFKDKVKSNSIPLVVAVKTRVNVIILGKEINHPQVGIAANCSMDVNTLSAGKEIKMSNITYYSVALNFHP
ncbi:NDR1/HIN1-like protein 13 [Rosa sericea]